MKQKHRQNSTKKLRLSTNTKKTKSSLPKISRNADLGIRQFLSDSSRGKDRHAMKQKHRQNVTRKYRQGTNTQKTRVRTRKFSQNTDLRIGGFFQTALGGTTPCNEAKTMEKHHQNTSTEHKHPKKLTKSSRPIIFLKCRPKTRRILPLSVCFAGLPAVASRN